MNPAKREARVAGLLYLLLSVAAVVSLGAIPSWSLVGGDPAATARRIADSGTLYRIGIVIDLAGQTLFVFLVLALFQMFKEVDRRQAALMVGLVLVQVPMAFANLLLGIAPLVLLSGADYWSVFQKDQLEALSMGCLNLRGHGVRAAMTFWGLWLLPFGLLVLRSGFIPRILGVLLIVGCLGYVGVSVTSLLFPAYGSIAARFTALAVGEILIILWLLIRGTRADAVAEQRR